jgi:asparagine synthase (glutamine-hydrolysing)
VSAIVGFFQRNGQPVDPKVLERMIGVLAHRGRDGSGTWADRSVGLGHLMLHDTPESLVEKQPLEFPAPRLAVTTDARIDNRDELIAALGLTPRDGEPVPDAALILAAYEKWETDCPSKLIGDFAFAIWDQPRRRLFCARDPMGVRPFYYHAGERVFAFASEIKALLALPTIPRRLNELQVAYYIEGILDDNEITFYDGILRLPAGHSLMIERERLHRTRYWDLAAVPEIRYDNDAEYAEAFRELFSESVRCRTRSALPVGAALSGGLDSSAVVCTARGLLAGSRRLPLDTFSAIFPSLPEEALRVIDERVYMQTVIDQGGLRPYFVRADRLSPLVDLDRIAWHLDQAPMGYNAYMSWGLYAAAHRRGCRVYLEGFGGDEIGGGHVLFPLYDHARRGEWQTFASDVRALQHRARALPRRILAGIAYPQLSELARRGDWPAWQQAADRLSADFGVRWWKLALRFGLVPRIVPRRLLDSVAARRRKRTDLQIINRAFARRVGLHQHMKRLRANGIPDGATARQMHQREFPTPLTEHVMEMANTLSAAFAVVPVYPFLDRRLIEFCTAIPAAQQIRDGWPRSLVRRAMEGVIPEQIRQRVRKQDLSPNFELGMRHHDRPLIEATLRELPPEIGGYLDLAAVRAARKRFFTDGGRRAESLDSTVLYHTVALARWLKSTLSGLGPS